MFQVQDILHGIRDEWVSLQGWFANLCVQHTGFLQLCKNTLVHFANLLSRLGMNAEIRPQFHALALDNAGVQGVHRALRIFLCREIDECNKSHAGPPIDFPSWVNTAERFNVKGFEHLLEDVLSSTIDGLRRAPLEGPAWGFNENGIPSAFQKCLDCLRRSGRLVEKVSLLRSILGLPVECVCQSGYFQGLRLLA